METNQPLKKKQNPLQKNKEKSRTQTAATNIREIKTFMKETP